MRGGGVVEERRVEDRGEVEMRRGREEEMKRDEEEER